MLFDKIFKNYAKGTSFEEMSLQEDKIAFLLGASISISTLVFQALLWNNVLSTISVKLKVITILVYSLFLALSLLGYCKNFNRTLRSILIILIHLTPLFLTAYIYINVFGLYFVIAYALIIAMYSFYRSDLLYIITLNIAFTTVAFIFNYEFLTYNILHNFHIMLPIIILWTSGIILSIFIVWINKQKTLEIARSTNLLVKNNEQLETQYNHINNLYTTLEETNSELEESNQLLSEKQNELMYSLYHDKLTNIPNRASFINDLNNLINTTDNDSVFAIAFFDIDSFKYINDILGHAVGDGVLTEVGSKLKRESSLYYSYGRIAGDEFAVIIDKGADDMSVLSNKLQSLRNHLNTQIEIDGVYVSITVSIGVALYPSDATNAELLMQRAEIAMQQVKERGRNDLAFFSQKYSVCFHRRNDIMNHFKNAFENEEFYLEYQPVIDIRANKVIGCEALLRWNSPILGNISPAEFIPIAEASGAMVEIGMWVIRNSLKNYRCMVDKLGHEFRMSINSSSIEIMSPNYIVYLLEHINKYNINPCNIVIEITESALLDINEATINRIAFLSDAGIRIALDDVGSGFFSFDYFMRLHVDVMKIDKSLIDSINIDNTATYSLLNALSGYAKSLNLEILGEGIENKEQYDKLRELSYNYAQGFFMSKSMSSDSYIDFFNTWKYNT